MLEPMATETGRNLNESAATPARSETVLLILVAASFSHLLNDTIQSLIPAIYPVLKGAFQLSFAQIGLITYTHIPGDCFVATASRGPVYGPPPAAIFLGYRDGVFPGRPGSACFRE